MTDEQMGLLGLGARAATVVAGSGGVRAALQRDEVALVVVASDHSPRTEEKVLRLARARGVQALTGPPAAELGRRLGRGTLQVVGVRDKHLAAGIIGSAERKDARRQ
jgi:ribosomal protein L7Ae-like RNA K-turn-binding protein